MILAGCGQNQNSPSHVDFMIISDVEPQPLLANAVRVSEALSFVGNALPTSVSDELYALQSQAHSEQTVKAVQELLAP